MRLVQPPRRCPVSEDDSILETRPRSNQAPTSALLLPALVALALVLGVLGVVLALRGPKVDEDALLAKFQERYIKPMEEKIDTLEGANEDLLEQVDRQVAEHKLLSEELTVTSQVRDALQTQAEQLVESVETLGAREARLQKQVGELQSTVTTLSDSVQRGQEKVRRLEAEITKAKATISRQRALIGDLAYDKFELSAQLVFCDAARERKVTECRDDLVRALRNANIEAKFKECRAKGASDPKVLEVNRGAPVPTPHVQLTSFPRAGGTAVYVVLCDPTLPD